MMVAQGGLMTMGAVDTYFVGRVSPLAMGAVALGNIAVGVVLVFSIGLAMGLEPLVSQAHGAGEDDETRAWLWQGWWLAAIGALPLMGLALLMTLVFRPLGIAEDLSTEATAYIWARLIGLFGSTIYATSRSYLTSVERVRPVVIAVVLANIINVIADYILVVHLGLGAVGIGIATTVCFLLMGAMVTRASIATVGVRRFRAPDLTRIFQIVKLGGPIGLQFSVEVGVFAVTGFMVARFGEVALAGHQIALTLSSVSFMAAVGLAVAGTTRVGIHVGRGRSDLARRSGILSTVVGAAWMAMTGALFLVFRTELATLFAPGQPDVIAMAETLIILAAIFAVSDGVQAVAAGALRGAGDTRWPFYVNVAAHWLVGFPIALWLGIYKGLGPAGFWWGLVIGLTGVAIMLVGRFLWLSARPMQRA